MPRSFDTAVQEVAGALPRNKKAWQVNFRVKNHLSEQLQKEPEEQEQEPEEQDSDEDRTEQDNLAEAGQIVLNEVAEDGGAIILLQFKRTPEPYMTLMVDLQAKHDQCGRGFSLLTASEMTLVQRVCPHLELKPWHILVREDEEKQLIARLRQIPSRHQVKCTSRIVVVTWTSRPPV